MDMPDAKTIVAALATLGMVAQFFGFTMPNANRADANRDANFTARDALKECNIERKDLLERLLEHDSSADDGIIYLDELPVGIVDDGTIYYSTVDMLEGEIE